MSINKWEHIFLKGEYTSREKLLSGLTLEQITAVPAWIQFLDHSPIKWHFE